MSSLRGSLVRLGESERPRGLWGQLSSLSELLEKLWTAIWESLASFEIIDKQMFFLAFPAIGATSDAPGRPGQVFVVCWGVAVPGRLSLTWSQGCFGTGPGRLGTGPTRLGLGPSTWEQLRCRCGTGSVAMSMTIFRNNLAKPFENSMPQRSIFVYIYVYTRCVRALRARPSQHAPVLQQQSLQHGAQQLQQRDFLDERRQY